MGVRLLYWDCRRDDLLQMHFRYSLGFSWRADEIHMEMMAERLDASIGSAIRMTSSQRFGIVTPPKICVSITDAGTCGSAGADQ